jgi:hypothetical protein
MMEIRTMAIETKEMSQEEIGDLPNDKPRD